jgi:phenylalanyl-tRNA synthetase alpha subunit
MSDATKLRDSALAAIAKARDDAELEAIEVEYLGRRDGKISRQLLSGIAQLDPSQRATLGQEANEAKRAVEAPPAWQTSARPRRSTSRSPDPRWSAATRTC